MSHLKLGIYAVLDVVETVGIHAVNVNIGPADVINRSESVPNTPEAFSDSAVAKIPGFALTKSPRTGVFSRSPLLSIVCFTSPFTLSISA